MTALKKVGGGKRKLVILAVAVAVGAALTWYVKNYVSLEALVAQEEKVREAIDRRLRYRLLLVDVFKKTAGGNDQNR